MHIKYKVWILFVISLLAWFYVALTWEDPRCKEWMWASDVPRWLDEQVKPVVYHNGDWVDAFGRVIGWSATEDSDVCVK